MTRAEELTLKLLDGSLADAEWGELNTLLAADSAAEAEHFALLDLEAVLRGFRTGFDLVGATLDRVKKVHAERTAAAVMAEILAMPSPEWAPKPAADQVVNPRRKVLFRCLAVGTVAAALLVGIWFGMNPPDPPVAGLGPAPDDLIPPSFATVTSVLGSVELLTPGGEVVPAEAGRAVAPGQTIRTVGEESSAVVELPDRTRFEIEPDTTVRFPATPAPGGPVWQVVLGQGQLKADVPDRPTGRPMLVSTPSADVLTRGGSFVVSSLAPESARVEPSRGSVQVARPVAPRPVSVGAGGAAVVQPWFERITVEQYSRVRVVPRRALSLEAYPGVRDAVFAPGGREIWAATGRMLVRWTADGGTAEVPFFAKKGGDGVAALFSLDRTALLTFGGEKQDGLVVRALPDGQERVTVGARIPEARFVTVAPAARWVATAQPKPNHKRVTVWDGGTGAVRFTRDVEEGITCLAATPAGDAVAVGVSDSGAGTHNKIVFFDPVSGDRRFALPTQRKAVTALAFSADGRYLAAGFTGFVQVWDVRSRDLIRTITGFERIALCLAFSADGKRLAGGTQDGQVWVWDVRSGNTVQQMEVGGRGVRAVCFGPDGRSLLTAASRAPVAVWDVVPETPADRTE
ncbi:MAG: domain, G-beta repeat [Gemmataceae bacterium]|nr:domain, G-beta repeat [Gemmataceae bacterium]